MSEARNHKPLPARLPEIESPAPGRPTRARPRGGSEAAESHRPTSREVTGARGPEADVPEVVLDVDGAVWRVRIVGRSGRAEGRSPPLLVLGFWPSDDAGPEPAREAAVVARTLGELGDPRLREAFGHASPPPPRDRRKPFFDSGNGGRRGGGPLRET